MEKFRGESDEAVKRSGGWWRNFESSGLRQNEFCRNEGLSLSTLRRQLKKRQLGKFEATHRGLVAVELARSSGEGKRPMRSALEVVLSNERRIEVWPDFDSPSPRSSSIPGRSSVEILRTTCTVSSTAVSSEIRTYV